MLNFFSEIKLLDIYKISGKVSLLQHMSVTGQCDHFLREQC